MRTIPTVLAGRPATIEEAGDGPSVVFVGSAVPMAWSRPAAMALSDRGFRVVNFDYSTDLDFGEPQAKTSVVQVDDVVSVMDLLEIDRAHVIGLSRGAVTAYGLAARHGVRVDRLILAFPVAPFPDVLHLEGDPPNVSAEAGESVVLDAVLDTAFSAEYLSRNRATARRIFLSPPGSVVRVERSAETPISDSETVEKPTLVISGSADAVVLPIHSQRLIEEIAGSVHHEFSGASHSFLMERPDEFAVVTAKFLEG